MDRRAAGATATALGAVVALAGCSASPRPSTEVTTPAPSAPAGGVGLREMGLRHGPADFWLPSTTLVTGTIDQPNVVTLFMPPAQGTTQARWLSTRLGDAWTIEASRGTSVVFHTRPGAATSWEGGFTCASKECALTLRRQ